MNERNLHEPERMPKNHLSAPSTGRRTNWGNEPLMTKKGVEGVKINVTEKKTLPSHRNGVFKLRKKHWRRGIVKNTACHWRIKRRRKKKRQAGSDKKMKPGEEKKHNAGRLACFAEAEAF